MRYQTRYWRVRQPRRPAAWILPPLFFIGLRIVLLLALVLAVVAGVVMFAWALLLVLCFFALRRWVFSQNRLQPAPATVQAYPAAAQPLRRQVDDLPEGVRERIERIRQKATTLAGTATTPEEQHLIKSTVDDYLPSAVDAYRSLPPGSADWPATAEGRTGLAVLLDQLELLEKGLDRIAGRA